MVTQVLVTTYRDEDTAIEVKFTGGLTELLGAIQSAFPDIDKDKWKTSFLQIWCDTFKAFVRYGNEEDNPIKSGQKFNVVFSSEECVARRRTTSAPDSLPHAKRVRKDPAAARVERWRKINEAVANKRNEKKQSTAYSGVTWSSVCDIFEPLQQFELKSEDFPDNVFQQLQSHLLVLNRCNPNWMGAKESHRFVYINAVMAYLFMNFDEKEFKFLYEADVNGDRVNVHGHFELVIECNKKKLCILEAKKDDFEKGSAQSLCGCEALSDTEDLSCIYSIVTDYSTQWMFYKSLDDRIYCARTTVDTVGYSFLYTESCLHKILNHLYWFVKQFFMEQQGQQ